MFKARYGIVTKCIIFNPDLKAFFRVERASERPDGELECGSPKFPFVLGRESLAYHVVHFDLIRREFTDAFTQFVVGHLLFIEHPPKNNA